MAGPGRSAHPWVISASCSTSWSTPGSSSGGAATASNTPSGPRCTGWQYSPDKDPCATSPRHHLGDLTRTFIEESLA